MQERLNWWAVFAVALQKSSGGNDLVNVSPPPSFPLLYNNPFLSFSGAKTLPSHTIERENLLEVAACIVRSTNVA